ETPVFMPVGTSGAVKGIWPRHIEEVGSTIILANTYHLLLCPGVDVVEQIGGLHKFMGWDKPILTDSGGYQVFSLNSLTRIDDEGVEFASHVDGQKFSLNAETATDIQNRLGADIIMCFDQCTEYPCEQEELNKAVERTIKWASECRKAHKNSKQLLFGIVQGGIDLELRKKCAEELVEMDFDGYAIGGLSVGEGHDNMVTTTANTTPLLPEEKPRYLMGVGMPADIIAGVKHGVDMFDCVLPTRNGRNAFGFTDNGPVRLRNSIHIADSGPVEEQCDCYCCSNFSRSAIRHFFNVGEMLGPILLSIHNLRFFQRLTQKIREKIEEGVFASWADDKIEHYLKLYS
ncbi:MAG: tRNA guanosine(34) transglycosylase Tgt, partial [Planctomycetota bacterium]